MEGWLKAQPKPGFDGAHTPKGEIGKPAQGTPPTSGAGGSSESPPQRGASRKYVVATPSEADGKSDVEGERGEGAALEADDDAEGHADVLHTHKRRSRARRGSVDMGGGGGDETNGAPPRRARRGSVDMGGGGDENGSGGGGPPPRRARRGSVDMGERREGAPASEESFGMKRMGRCGSVVARSGGPDDANEMEELAVQAEVEAQLTLTDVSASPPRLTPLRCLSRVPPRRPIMT
jgi:hypothetical protein